VGQNCASVSAKLPRGDDAVLEILNLEQRSERVLVFTVVGEGDRRHRRDVILDGDLPSALLMSSGSAEPASSIAAMMTSVAA